MAILKYKINGQWVELGGTSSGGGSSVEVDPSLSIEGAAADAKVTGEMIAAIGEAAGNAVSMEVLEGFASGLSESISGVEAQVVTKQNKVLFNTTQPADWQNGDIWLKPAE